MKDFQEFVSESMLWVEGLTALIGIFYYNHLKQNHWKLFVFYLILIFLCEAFGRWGNYDYFSKAQYYNYFVMPVQFIFFYWLYAAKSLGKPKLFLILSGLYLFSFIPSELYFSENSKIVFAFNYTFGCLILMLLVVMEYYKQINSTDILNFGKNRMFYINLAVTLFYIGTLPFLTFYSLLRNYLQIWNIYFDYFLISGVAMYILFSISFVWGKQNS